MNFKAAITGIAASAILLALLGVARLFTMESAIPEFAIREIETATFEPPPPPPQMEEPPPIALPPPPAIASVSSLPDPTHVPVPQAQVPMNITAPVENFFSDLAPAPLPVAPEPVHERLAPKNTPDLRPPPVAKSHYQSNELDGTPRLLRHGSATFPPTLARQGVNRGTVTFEVELSTSGAVSIRSVVSSTHQELVPAARRVVSGARFTPPKKNGQAVKAIMRWPIVIEK